MKNGMTKTVAVAAVVAGGILAGGTATANAAPSTQGQRITSQEQLSASIQKAVAAEQARGVVVEGIVGGRSVSTSADDVATA
jgi:hypothetical protein